MQQFTHVDKTIVSSPVHSIMAFIVAIVDDGSGCQQEICQSHVTTLHGAQKWSETKIVSEVNISTSMKQTECGPDKTAYC